MQFTDHKEQVQIQCTNERWTLQFGLLTCVNFFSQTITLEVISQEKKPEVFRMFLCADRLGSVMMTILFYTPHQYCKCQSSWKRSSLSPVSDVRTHISFKIYLNSQPSELQMGHHVCFQVGFHIKPFMTDFTFIGFLSCVNHQVTSQKGPTRETFATVKARFPISEFAHATSADWS